MVARQRASLVDRDYFVYEANDEVVLAMLDMQETYSRTRRAGVATPSTCVVRDERDVEPALHDIGFPCALKPRFMHIGSSTTLAFGRRHSRSRSIRRRAAHLRKLGLEVMLTEIIPGGDDQRGVESNRC